jgi:Zn-dependent protease with chaperone function/Zn-finger nucleic acid-binding protein
MSTGRDSRRPLFEIEREKRWRVWLLFALLLAMVSVAVWVACLIVSVCLFVLFPVVDTVGWVFTLRGVALIVLIALPATALYWFLSRIGAGERLLRAMHCVPLDPGDKYHQRLANIVEEMRLATGGPRIDCYTVQTLGLNAFAFSDLRGGGVIGVTEGALARLSRQQLQGVVAHEIGHILSGSYVTVTVSCLLFGIYSSLGDEMEDAAFAGASANAAPVAVVALLLRGWLWILQTASSVTDAALSRERERQADLAAARFTRDPLSLAEALRIIERHPGGAGYIPGGLAPLCIRDTQGSLSGPLASWRRTHPPIAERVAMLLALANVSPADFDRQFEQATEHFEQREHWSPSPTAVTVVPAAMAGALSGAVPDAGAAPRPAFAARGVVAPAAAADCPTCGASLRAVDYEGVPIAACGSCGGCLVADGALKRILARREVGFTDDQRRLAEHAATFGDQQRRAARVGQGQSDAGLIRCPRCAKTMMRGHFNYEHAIEVDRCAICDLVWFDRDELEALQMLTERQVD